MGNFYFATRGAFWRRFLCKCWRKAIIYGVVLICHVETEMPLTLTYLVLRPFEVETLAKRGTRATWTNPAPLGEARDWAPLVQQLTSRSLSQTATAILKFLRRNRQIDLTQNVQETSINLICLHFSATLFFQSKKVLKELLVFMATKNGLWLTTVKCKESECAMPQTPALLFKVHLWMHLVLRNVGERLSLIVTLKFLRHLFGLICTESALAIRPQHHQEDVLWKSKSCPLLKVNKNPEQVRDGQLIVSLESWHICARYLNRLIQSWKRIIYLSLLSHSKAVDGMSQATAAM